MINLSSKTSAYLALVPAKIKLSEYPLTKLDLPKLEGIQKDIPVFKNVSMEDIAFLTKQLITLNLFRGCKVGCLHCLKNAAAPLKGRESILYEDLENVTDGFKSLNERLGFDSLNGNEFLTTFDDSNPLDMPIKGLNREHNLVEAMKLIYEKLHIPTLVVTSGWQTKNAASEYSQKTAEALVDYAKKTPDAVRSVDISINPFVKVKDYSDRMANTLFTFLDLFRQGKAKIIYRHAIDDKQGFGEETAKNMYKNIYSKLQNLVGSKLESIPELKPETVTEFDRSHFIEPQGRGRKLFPFERNMKVQRELIDDAIEWECYTDEEKCQILRDCTAKCIDIDGSVYTIKPSSAECINAPIEVTIPANIQLNYINKEKPNPIYSDIDM